MCLFHWTSSISGWFDCLLLFPVACLCYRLDACEDGEICGAILWRPDDGVMSLVVGTSFNLLLMTACAGFAFIVRDLPDNYNESWYIFLCVVTTLVIWIAFFTTYISVFYVVYKAALLAAALILISLVVVVAFFGPKIYAIAFIADKDIQITDFEGSISYGNRTQTSMVSTENTEGVEK